MYLISPSVDKILATAEAMAPQPDEVLLLLLGEASPIDIDDLVEQLGKTPYSFVGGIFPSVISAESHSQAGVVMETLPALNQTYLIHDLNQGVNLPDFEAVLDASEDIQLTALILIDGLTSEISEFLAELYDTLGNSVRYLGGGAGSLSLSQKPCVFTREGCFQDAAVIAFISLESQLGVRHGWQRLKGPFPATKTHKNTIVELNWKNAFDVYKEVVEADSHQSINQDNFFEIAKAYPFGIYKEGQEDIVRDPITVNDSGELVCVGEVPENALLYLLKGDKNSLITSARQAAMDATSDIQGKLRTLLVVDCISRVLFLDEIFSEELVAFHEPLDLRAKNSVLVEGVLTLGEISSYGDGFLEFFNKTVVVGAFYRE